MKNCGNIYACFGKSGTATIGKVCFTNSRSAGLSSMNTILSRPMFSSLDSSTIFEALSFQFIRIATKSFFLKTINGFCSQASNTSSSLFLLQTDKIIPSLLNADSAS